ncbi:MAG: glycine--tRNA ligase subunit beta [Rickettsiales bacterium]|nr:glycine--tRNA ligase subunit beta [Rickettsiales bacterium]
MAQLILEIFSEEIPARMQFQAADSLHKSFEEKLKSQNIYFQNCKSFVTPRRLILFAEGLSLTQEDSVSERKGPSINATPEALEGFIRSTGLSKDKLTIKSTPKGDFYFAIIRTKGKQTKEILREILEDILQNFHWQKSMRWGENKIRWVRPIRNIACVFGGDVLPIKFGHLESNNISFGHRFLAPEQFKIENFDQFISELEKRFVLADHQKRKKLIAETIQKIGVDNNLVLIQDEHLLNEVTGLVEWPVCLLGSIENKFMSLPPEVLVTTIKTNQKYFNFNDREGNLSPYFVVVSNNKTKDGGLKIIEGNEKVVRARLSDAEFFYRTDKEKGLANFISKLDGIIFHNKIGTMGEKVERISKLAHDFAKELAPDKKDLASQTAYLAKADLASGMVGEFPELQGLMGYYYAIANGEHKEIAEAIRDHYKPQGPNDYVPRNSLSAIIALGDKLETLVSLYVAGERATGSKDPFALRRLALGIIRIILENKLSFDLIPYIKKSLKLLPSQALREIDKDETINEITSFFIERIKFQLKNENFRAENISAIVENSEELNIFDIKQRIIIFSEFIETSDGSASVEAYKRAKNILSIEEKKDKISYPPKPSKSQLSEGSEKFLYEILEDISDKNQSLMKQNKFAESLKNLCDLSGYINNFYDNTQINSQDKKVRENRLKLSALITKTFEEICGFNKI